MRRPVLPWRALGSALPIALAAACGSQSAVENSMPAFEAELERLREEHHIPGMSVAVVHHQKIVLARGFGFADLESQTPADADTPYNIASLTKPISAVVVMQLVEQGELDLDAPMARVLADAPFPIRYHGERIVGYREFCRLVREAVTDPAHPLHDVVAEGHADYRCDTERPTVRHHLSHTAAGVPGSEYRYNGDLYGWLATAAEAASGGGQPFRQLLVDHIVRPLGMTGTVPSVDDSTREAIRRRRATYYQASDGGYSVVEVTRPFAWPAVLAELGLDLDVGFAVNAGAGIVSTVVDLAAFDVALDRNRLLSEDTKALMLTPTVANDGRRLPYALGWFVEQVGDETLVWHYGQGGAYSSLYLKVPSHDLTLILLGNSGGVSAFPLGRGDVLVSPFARAFLAHVARLDLPPPPS